MTEVSTSRTKITFGCSREFKERVQAAARRRGLSVGDWFIALAQEDLKFVEFFDGGTADEASEDWQKLAAEARARRGD